MNSAIDRRGFLRATGRIAAGMGLAGLASPGLLAADAPQGAPHAEKLGWRLACQMYTFNRFTFYESLQKVASLGLKYIEGYASHSLSHQQPDIRTNASMPPAVRQEVKRRLAAAGVSMVSYYSVRLSADEKECRQEFDFARDLGVQTLVCDAPRRAVDLLEKLAEQYQISVALHNHDQPSPYWNLDSLLRLCQGRSQRIGICGDTGYWMREQMKPVEMVSRAANRLICLYLKDVNTYGRKGVHDVPFGTGVGDIRQVMEQVHRQGIKPVFVIEYTYDWLDSLPEVAQCVQYFDKVAAELATG